jgi:aryl-alcohol dehydrogenase-like predicted oxidoreductase
LKNIIIGTAQLTGKYGICNFSKKSNKKKMINFLEFCYKNSLKYFDTAPNYLSEEIIGEFVKINNLKDINISTKIPSLHEIKRNFKISFIKESLDNSYNRLQVKNIDTLYFHDENDIDFFFKNLNEIKNILKSYKIKNIGFSIYSKNVLKKIEKNNDINTVQIPFNIIDNSWLNILSKKKKIIARSIFLQGLLINICTKKKNKILNNFIKDLLRYSVKNKLNLYDLCLNYALSKKKINKLILGFDNIKQVKRLVNYKKNFFDESHISNINEIASTNFLPYIIDPRKW